MNAIKKTITYRVSPEEHAEISRVHKAVKGRFGSIEKILPRFILDCLVREEKSGFSSLKKYL